MGTAQSLSKLCPCREAQLSRDSSAAATRTLSDRPSIFYTRNRSEAGGGPDARTHTHCTEERIAKESARAVLGCVRPRLPGSCGCRDKCARSAAARSGRSMTFHQTSPRSLHPLFFHVRRGKPANLSGKRRGELETGELKGPPVPSPGPFPLRHTLVPVSHLYAAGCAHIPMHGAVQSLP